MLKDFSRASLHFLFLIVPGVLIDFAVHCVVFAISFVAVMQFDNLLDGSMRLSNEWRDLDRHVRALSWTSERSWTKAELVLDSSRNWSSSENCQFSN